MDFSDIVQTPTSSPDETQAPQETTQPPQVQKKPYWEVLDTYNQFKSQNPQHAEMSLPEFVGHANEATGTNQYDEGLNDSGLRRAGANVQIAMHKFGGAEPGTFPSGIPTLAQAFGGPREGVDLPEAARRASEAAATRYGVSPGISQAVGTGAAGFVENVPTMAAGLIPGVGIPAMAGMAGLTTYGETGRALPSVISGATTALIPKFMEAGGQAALKAVGAPMVKAVAPELLKLLPEEQAAETAGSFVPSNLVQRGVEFAGKQVGLLANVEAGQAGQTVVDPNLSVEDKLKTVGSQFTPSSLVSTAIGQLPFTLMDAATLRTNPLARLRADVGADFARRYADAAKKGDPETGAPGFVATPNQIGEAATRLMTGRVTPESTEGKVLKSMGVGIPEPSPLIKTQEGDWAPGLAIDATRTRANNALFEMGIAGNPIGAEHTQTLDTVVRGVERANEGRPLSRDEFTQQAASRMIDLYSTYKDSLAKLGPEPVEKMFPNETRYYESQKLMDAKIAGAVTPGSPTYDRDVHQRIALVEGDPEHWIDAGLTDVQMNSVSGAYKVASAMFPELEVTRRGEAAVGLNRNIINFATGLGPKPTLREEVLAKIQEAKDIDTLIAQRQASENPFDDAELARQIGERDKAMKIAEQLKNQGTWERSGQTPNGYATFAARRRAFNYGNTPATLDRPLDVNDPKSVSRFVSDIVSTMKDAEKAWSRKREKESTVSGPGGEPLTFATAEDAVKYAQDLENTSKYEQGLEGYATYFVPRDQNTGDFLKNKDGTYNITKQSFYSTFGIPEERGVELAREAPEGQFAGVPEPETTERQELKTLSEIPNELFSQRFKELAALHDPAESESRKLALANHIVNFVVGMPDAKLKALMQDATGANIRGLAKLKAQFVSYVKFLQVGGKVDTFRGPDGRIRGKGDLDGLNQFMGDVGFGVYSAEHPNAGSQRGDDFNRGQVGKRGGMNFFEQFAVLANEMQKHLQDPRTFKVNLEDLPRGNFAFVPKGTTNDFDKQLTVPRVDAVTANRPGYAKMGEGEVLKLTDPKTGEERRFETPYNPLETFFVKATTNKLTGKAGELADMFAKYAPDADPRLVQELQTLMEKFPYLRQQNVGVAPALDLDVKGYFHTDDVANSAGILLNPYEFDPSRRNPVRLMTPKDVLPHFLDELGHTGTQFAYMRFPDFKAEVDRTFNYIKSHVDNMRDLLGVEYAPGAIHALSRPEEMLSAMFHNGQFHELLKGIKDPFEPLPRTERTGSMFDRVLNMIRNLFSKLVGEDTAGTMFDRVSELSTRGLELQRDLSLSNSGDIYQFLYSKGLIGDIIHAGGPEPVPKGVEGGGVFPPVKGQDILAKPTPSTLPQDPIRQMLAADVQRNERNVAYVDWDTAQPLVLSGDTPEAAKTKLSLAQDRLARYDAGTLAPEETFTPSILRDRESSLVDLQTRLGEYQQMPDTNPQKERLVDNTIRQIAVEQTLVETLRRLKAVPTGSVLKSLEENWNKGRAGGMSVAGIDYNGLVHSDPNLSTHGDLYDKIGDKLIDGGFVDKQGFYHSGTDYGSEADLETLQLIKKYNEGLLASGKIPDPKFRTPTGLGQTAPEGSVLESRVNPQNVLDAMNAASTYPIEEPDRLWFKPYNLDRFRQTFGPAFGMKMSLERKSGQWGYSIPKDALNNVTSDDLSRMPKPQVKPWTVSLHDSLTSMMKQQGSDDATSNAVANYALQFASVLKGTDQTIWAKTKGAEEVKSLLGWAYNDKLAGITNLGAVAHPTELANVVRHESTHVALNSPDVVAATKTLNDTFTSMSEVSRRAFLDGLSRLTEDDLGVRQSVYELAITDPEEFAAEFMAHVGNMLGTVPNPSAYLRDTMRFAPDEVSNLLVKDSLRRMQGIDRLQALMKQSADERGVNPKELLEPLNKLWNTFSELSRQALDIAQEQADFQHMRLLYPDTYQQLLDQMSQTVELSPDASEIKGQVYESRMYQDIRKFFRLPTPDGRLPDKLGFWDKQLTQFSAFANKYPVARSFYDMLRTARAIAQETRIKLTTALAGAYEGGKVTDDTRTRQIAQFTKNVGLRSLFSKIGLDINKFGDGKFDEELAGTGDIMAMNPENVTGWLTPDYINGLMDKYGVADKDKPVLQTVLDGVRNQMKLVGSNIVGSQLHAMETMVAKAVANNTDLPPEAARSAAKTLSQAMQLQTTDTNQAMQLLQQFQTVVKDPEVYGRIFDMAQAGWEGVQRMERFLALRMPYFMSERRGGGFGLVWSDANDKVRSQYWGSAKERDDYLRAHPDIEPMRTLNPQDRDYGVPQQVFNILDEQQKRLGEKLVGLFGKKEADQMSQLLDFSTDLRDALNARDVLKLTTGRELAPGREDLDMFQTHQHYVNATTGAIRNRFIRLEAELLFTDPNFANQPNIKDYVDGHIKSVLQPDSPLGSRIQQLGFLYYLWGNPSSMIMQTSHQLMGLAPMLTARGASVAGSYATILKANKMLVDSKLGSGYKDAEIQQMINRARREGVITSWIARELDHTSDLSMVNRMRATTGQSMWEPFDLLKNKLYQGYSLIRRLYDTVPIYNSEIAFVSSLLHLRSKVGGSLSGDQLFNEAAFLKDNTMFPGGKENRPGFFQSVPRSAAQSIWSLQTYANGLTTMMGELIRKSVNPKGLTPAQATQTRKAAAQMLIAQSAVAGVLGLPFAQAALYGLQKIFPQHNIEQDVKDALASLFGDDQATGQTFGTAVTTGVPNILDYGPDLGSRFALAGTFHVSPYSGIGWQQLVGPTGGIISRAIDGLQAGARGDPLGTVQDLMPNGFQRIWKTLEQGNTYTTESGQMVTNNLRPTEIAARIIGFRPARIARIEEFERLSKLSEDAEKAQQTNWTHEQVDMLKQNRDAEVRQNIAQRVTATKGVYPAAQLSNDISREFERQSMPVDLRRFGNRATVLAQKSLRGGLGSQDEGPNNTDRLMLQQQIAQRLGLGGPKIGQFRHASNVDALMQMYPHLTTPQANLMLNHALGSRPTSELYQELLTSGE